MNQTIKSGDKKDIGSPLKQMSDDERKILQSVIDSMYERFLTVITEGRADLTGMNPVELKKIADGRIYTAEQALKLKLIDKTGYMDDAVEYAKGLAGIKEARLITYAPERSYKNNIYSLAGEQAKINLINIDGSALTGKFGMSFMYLWMP
jgi:protease-4